MVVCFFFQAEDGIRDIGVTGVQTCALPISPAKPEGGEPTMFLHSANACIIRSIPDTESCFLFPAGFLLHRHILPPPTDETDTYPSRSLPGAAPLPDENCPPPLQYPSNKWHTNESLFCI